MFVGLNVKQDNIETFVYLFDSSVWAVKRSSREMIRVYVIQTSTYTVDTKWR